MWLANNIPNELKGLKRWLYTVPLPDPGKKDRKMPFGADLKPAKWSNPASWMAFPEKLPQTFLWDGKSRNCIGLQVRESGCDPALHYLEKGAQEGRDPGPRFCTRAYVRRNPDVANAGVNPLVHYETHGRKEGRSATGWMLSK